MFQVIVTVATNKEKQPLSLFNYVHNSTKDKLILKRGK